MKHHFKKDVLSVQEGIKLRNDILSIFVKKYKRPVLVHSTNIKKNFKSILLDGKIKLPLDHSFEKKCPHMEKLLKIDNCVYLSIGFIYPVRYDFKYSLIFSLDSLKELEYYSRPLPWGCYRAIVDYIFEKDRSYFDKLKEKSKVCNQVVDKYLNVENDGKKRVFFDFWKDEKNIYEWLASYSNQKVLIKIINKKKKEIFVKYPESISSAKELAFSEKVPEILSRKEINLLESQYFLGFYIKENVPVDIMKILKKKYAGKIIFDGKKIDKIV